jgi:CRP-like cAMP-binding protein
MNASSDPSINRRGLIQASTLFAHLGDEDLSEVLRAARSQARNDQSFFFMQGDPGEDIFILISGQVKLTQLTPDGQQLILEYISPGKEFGLMAVLSDIAYPISAQAVGECEALAWGRMTLKRLIQEYPPMAINAMSILAAHVRELQSRLQEVTTQRVEQRIARTLLRLAQQSGVKNEEGVVIDLPLTRQDLAEMSGTTLYTVSRTLTQWEKQGLIRSHRAQVMITFPHGLVRIAEDLPGDPHISKISSRMPG